MSPTEQSARRERLLAAALAIGVRRGVGALSLQAIAADAGVSKALLLYHFSNKTTLLDALVEWSGQANAERMREAARAPHPMPAWRALLGDDEARGECALLAALAIESGLSTAPRDAVRAQRESAAASLAAAVLREVGLVPRVPGAALGRLLLRQFDGLACAGAWEDRAALDAEIDTFALAMIGLGR